MTSLTRPSKYSLAALVAASLFIGCAVGPEYKPPAAPTALTYTSAPLPEQTAASPVTGGSAQRFISGKSIPDQWWTLFHSEALDGLIRRALKDSPTLAAAQARLRQAQETRLAQYGALFPQVDANLSATRQKISGAAFGSPENSISAFNLFNASVNVTYALDIFGATRRQLEALQSQVDYQRFQLEGAHLTLASNVVTAAVKEASLRRQIRMTRDIIAIQEKQLAIVERQFQLGAVSRSDVLIQRAQLAQTRSTLPQMEKDMSQTRHLLAVLAGRPPSEAALPEFDLDGFHLPEDLPVSLPSALVRQRPDIAAAEALLHAASAQVGVATANLYPQITLVGGYGSSSTTLGEMFSGPSTVWNIGAGLLQPIFRGGQLTARRRAAIAAYDQAAAQYRDTVLQAFQNVADILRALEADALTLKAQSDAEAAAREARDLAQSQFGLGAVNYLTLLTAQRQHEQAQISLAQAQASRFADAAALFQALGGGWWNRQAADTADAVRNK